MRINDCCPVYVGHTCWARSNSAKRELEKHTQDSPGDSSTLAAALYFPLPLADTGGLLFLRGIEGAFV